MAPQWTAGLIQYVWAGERPTEERSARPRTRASDADLVGGAIGIVIAEAMACGTPVLGFRRGAVPEIVTDGETGFVVDSTDELVEAVDHCSSIDRATVRRRCETNYSDAVIADAYIEVLSTPG